MTEKTDNKGMLIRQLFFFVGIIVLWETICRLNFVDTFFFSSPSKVINTAYKMFSTGQVQRDIMITLKRFSLGFFLGGILGLIVGSCCGISKKISSFVEPLIYLIYPVPKFALLPFMILIFGTGIGAKVIFISMGAFFPIAINTISGIQHINKDFLEVAEHYGAKGWRLYKRVILPGSLPSVFAGLRIAIGIALTYVLIIEFLTATDGIGAMMWLSLQTLRIDKLLLGTIIIALANVILTSLLKGAEKFLIPWDREESNVTVKRKGRSAALGRE